MINEPVLMDTGPLIALYSTTDRYHAACQQQMALLPVGKVYTCWPVITEAVYLLRKHPRQRDALLETVASSELILLRLDERDIRPIFNIFRKYHDQQVDLADACLLHLSNREAINTVFTVDYRHFNVFRQQNGESLRIVPDQHS